MWPHSFNVWKVQFRTVPLFFYPLHMNLYPHLHHFGPGWEQQSCFHPEENKSCFTFPKCVISKPEDWSKCRQMTTLFFLFPLLWLRAVKRAKTLHQEGTYITEELTNWGAEVQTLLFFFITCRYGKIFQLQQNILILSCIFTFSFPPVFLLFLWLKITV